MIYTTTRSNQNYRDRKQMVVGAREGGEILFNGYRVSDFKMKTAIERV